MSDPVRKITLTAEHVARIELPVEGPRYDPSWQLLEDAELDALAVKLTEGRPRPIPVFAYGSLIWNPGFAVGRRRRGVAQGWHRDFIISLDQFRASPEYPGLMLALASGGTCEGVLLDIEEGTEVESLRALLKRELAAHHLSGNAAWVSVETDTGREEALTFYADPVGVELADLPIEEQARRLSRANGVYGSGAGYLRNTVLGLEEQGIHDDYLWRLQALVADEIDRIEG